MAGAAAIGDEAIAGSVAVGVALFADRTTDSLS